MITSKHKTPPEIVDYKISWMVCGAHSVKLHSDLIDEGRAWCEEFLAPWEYNIKPGPGSYEYTFYFETNKLIPAFTKRFGRFVTTAPKKI